MPAPITAGLASLLLGLTLVGCGDDSTGDDGAAESTTAVSAMTAGETADPGMTSTPSNATSTTDVPPDGEASVAAYGGPDVDTTPNDTDETADDGTTASMDDDGTTGTGGSSGGSMGDGMPTDGMATEGMATEGMATDGLPTGG